MYEIYINDRPLRLMHTSEADALHDRAGILLARYPGRARFLLNYVDMMEKGRRFDSVALYSDDSEGLWQDFRSLYKLVEAAGGVVRNPEGAVLFIFRRGFWDLPKGKIDPGESPEEAALREVAEETGAIDLQIIRALPDTWHTFRQKGKRILKRTIWFDMLSSQNQQLMPQSDEGILEVCWKSPQSLLEIAPKTYANIRRLLEAALAE